MRGIAKFVVLVSLLLPTGIALAGTTCPSTEYIRTLDFIEVDGVQDIWDLFSKTFVHANRKWRVTFTVYLPDAKDKVQAMELGNYFYRANVDFFNSPFERANPEAIVCYYAQMESSYFVRAVSYHNGYAATH